MENKPLEVALEYFEQVLKDNADFNRNPERVIALAQAIALNRIAEMLEVSQGYGGVGYTENSDVEGVSGTTP